MTRLYELFGQYDAIDRALASAQDELQEEELLARLNAVEGEVDYKLSAMASMIKNYEAEAEMIKAEEERLKAKRERCKRRSESLRGYVEYMLRGASWKNNIHAFGWRKSEVCEPTGEIEITPEFLYDLPADCRREVHEVKPDLSNIKRALKAGELILGFKLVEKQNLQVK
jgi:hypothetical protein